MRVAGARTFVPALDGIRGIAILLVAAFHFVSQAAQIVPGSGWAYRLVTGVADFGSVGVDLFFVLSGFLITGLLLDSKASTHFFRNFYARRTLRIFPLYYAFLFVLLVVAPLVLPGNALIHDAGRGQAWVWLYASNLRIAALDHWAFCGAVPCGQGIELNHTWSLAVEEHFYLVWPLVVFYSSRRDLVRTCGALALAALVFRVAFRHHALTMYTLTPCRMDALVIGAFVATAVRERGLPWLLDVGRAPAAIATVLLAVTLGLHGRAGAIVQPLVFTLQAVVCAAILVGTLASSSAGVVGVNTVAGQGAGKGPLARALGNRVLRTFGKYSYGLYLFHSAMRPVMMRLFPAPWLAERLGSAALGLVAYDVLATAASLGMAAVSYHVFEKHFLRWKDLFSEGRISPRALDIDASPDTIR